MSEGMRDETSTDDPFVRYAESLNEGSEYRAVVDALLDEGEDALGVFDDSVIDEAGSVVRMHENIPATMAAFGPELKTVREALDGEEARRATLRQVEEIAPEIAVGVEEAIKPRKVERFNSDYVNMTGEMTPRDRETVSGMVDTLERMPVPDDVSDTRLRAAAALLRAVRDASGIDPAEREELLRAFGGR